LLPALAARRSITGMAYAINSSSRCLHRLPGEQRALQRLARHRVHRRRPAELHHDRAAERGDQPEIHRKQTQAGVTTVAEEGPGGRPRPDPNPAGSNSSAEEPASAARGSGGRRLPSRGCGSRRVRDRPGARAGERTECHRPSAPGRPWPGTRRSGPARPPRRRESRRRSRCRPRPAIAAVLVHHDTNLYDLTVTANGRTAVIDTTTNHPFWDAYLDKWVSANKLSKNELLRASNGATVTVVGGTAPKQHDGWMWDLTVPGNNDHDFYVIAGNAG